MSVVKYAKVIWEDFVSLIYPQICVHCADNLVKNELYLCTSCRANLPLSDYHLNGENPIQIHFRTIRNLDLAAVYLHFHRRGLAQSILHEIKYKGQKELAFTLGLWYGKELKQQLSDYDMIIPVPLHKSKLKTRGFNQSEFFANGLGESLGVSVEPQIVSREKKTSTQTKKSRVERWTNVADVYRMADSDELSGKSVIVVDDVITTGATIGSLCELISPYVDKLAILAIASGKKA